MEMTESSSGDVVPRKIVLIDMDPFYASVEQRNDPSLRGKPVVVAWRGAPSLDEAYLDVTENKNGLATATLVAKAIRQQIRKELQLTASAAVAPNKFLAKIASDWRKPDGLFVIQPGEVNAFLPPLCHL